MPVDATRPARQTALREHNLGLVLGEIADRGPASRARIAAGTGLTKATVSSLVDLLVAAGLVAEREIAPVGPGGVGRPGRPVALAGHGPAGIGLEINVDYLATCTVDLSGAVLQRQLVVADQRTAGPEAAIGRAAPMLRRAVADAGAAGRPVAGIAVAVPGLVQTGTETLRLAPNLGWRDVPVLDALRAAGVPELPMRLDNEANLAALAELWVGELRSGGHPGPDSFVHVSGEVGVGAAVVTGGRLFRGLHGFAGEIGHLPVAPGAATGPCACGGSGCLEQVAGQEAMLRAAGLPVPGDHPEGPVAELVARARAGDARALAALAGAGEALGTGVAAVVNLLDVGTVVLGGVYAALAPWLAGPVAEAASRRVLAAPWAPVRVLPSRLGGEAAVRGAATAVVRDVIADPAGYLARVTPA